MCIGYGDCNWLKFVCITWFYGEYTSRLTNCTLYSNNEAGRSPGSALTGILIYGVTWSAAVPSKLNCFTGTFTTGYPYSAEMIGEYKDAVVDTGLVMINWGNLDIGIGLNYIPLTIPSSELVSAVGFIMAIGFFCGGTGCLITLVPYIWIYCTYF